MSSKFQGYFQFLIPRAVKLSSKSKHTLKAFFHAKILKKFSSLHLPGKATEVCILSNNAVNYETKGYRIQERVGPGKENSEGKPLNDGCVQGLKYNPFRQRSDDGGVTDSGARWGEKMGKLNGYKMCSEFGKN